jgi:hypothetical protein
MPPNGLATMPPDEAEFTPPAGHDPTLWLAREVLVRIDREQDIAREQRKEQTAAIRELAADLRRHMDGEEKRDAKLLAALKARDSGAEAALRELAAEKSVARRWVETAAKEAWSSFKVPLAGLVTAACAYSAWAHFQIPAAPVEVGVRGAGAGSAEASTDDGGAE